MKVIALLLLLAVNALAYNPFPIKAYIQRGNGERIEVPELEGQPSPDKVYRIWFTNVVYTEVWNTGHYDDFGNEIVETNVLDRRGIEQYADPQFSDKVTLTFEFDENVGDASLLDDPYYDAPGVFYFGMFNNAFTNCIERRDAYGSPYYTDPTGFRGFGAWYVPYEDEYVGPNTKWTEQISLFDKSYDDYSHYSNGNEDRYFYGGFSTTLTLTTNSWSCESQQMLNPRFLMCSTDLGTFTYLLSDIRTEGYASRMGGISRAVRNGVMTIVFRGDRWNRVAGYIDICGASILGDPSQELKIEQFEVDLKNNGDLGMSSGWDLYVKIPHTNTCPVCHEQIGHAVMWERSTYITNETGYIIGRNVPTEVHCPYPECGAALGIEFPKEFDRELYAYHYRYTDQVNVHFVISVPKEWCSERLLDNRYSDDDDDDLYESGIGIWATDELGNDSTLLFGYGEDDNSSLSGKCRYTCPGQGYSGDWRFETQNITPTDYPPTRVLIDIKASYLVQVNRGSGGRPEPCSLLGNELKQTFYHFTYFHP